MQTLPAWQRLATTSVKGASYTDIYVSKGETESFQLGIWSTRGNHTVTWTAPAGLTVKAYTEAWVYVSKTGGYSGEPNRPLPAGWYPDGLRPLANGGTISSDGSKANIVWFDVKTSRTIATGVYTVNLTAAGYTSAMRVHVWNFALPEKPRLKSAIGLWGTRGKLAAETLLLDNRLMPTFIDSTHATTLSTVGQTQAHAGFWAGMNNSAATIATVKPTSSQVDAAIARQQPLAPYAYLADEVYNDSCSSVLRNWSAALAGKVDRMVTIAPRAGWEWLDIFVELPKFHVQSAVDAAIGRGSEVWLYQTLSQDSYSPKWLITYPYPNWVLMSGFLPWKHKLTGLLYWKADLFTPGNPWATADNYGTSYPGEAQWILPLSDGTYAPTIRLKWLRDGVDTYDYLSLLKDRGQKAFADQVTASVAPDFRNWSRDPAAIEAARRQLGDKLNSLLAADVYRPPISPLHTIRIWADAAPSVVSSSGTVRLSAVAQDSNSHRMVSWQWSDGGAGGSFSPSAQVANPTYTAPINISAGNHVLALTVRVACAGRAPVRGIGLAPLTVQGSGSSGSGDRLRPPSRVVRR